MAIDQMVAIAIFVITYFLIASEKIDRTIAAMLGAAVVMATGIVSSEELLEVIDVHAIGLLFGMMIIVGVLREAQFFRYVGILLANFCGCQPKKMFILFTTVTALLSAILDNVTTVLFMIAVTIEIMRILEIDPTPFVFGEIMACNIGGTATLIGDPPNIMIASAAGLSFMDFIVNVAPIAIVAMFFSLGVLLLLYKTQLQIEPRYSRIPIDPSEVITDHRMFRLGIAVLAITLVLFFLHDLLHIDPSTIALGSALLLLAIGGSKMPQVLEDVEWRTLLFFACLFVVVGGLEKTGIISIAAQWLAAAIGENQLLAVIAVLWVSAFASALIDNIPFVAAFIPLLIDLAATGGLEIRELWWALSIGAGFGGNGTPVGSSANIVAIGVFEKSGYAITFKTFVKIGLLNMLITTAVASLFLFVRASV